MNDVDKPVTNPPVDKTGRRDHEVWLQVEVIAAFVAAIVATAVVLAVIPYFVHSSFDPAIIEKLFVWPITPFAPEPVERWRYVIGLVVFPLFLIGFTAVARLAAERFSFAANPVSIRNLLLAVLGAAALVLGWFDNQASNSIYVREGPFAGRPILFTSLFLLTMAANFFLNRERRSVVNRVTLYLSDAFAVAIALYLAFTNIFSTSWLLNGFTYFNSHLNAVLYSVTQVAQGKTLLVNLPNQYGFYPHFLAPVFAVVGLTLPRFTLVMGLLIAAGVSCIYVFLRRVVRNKWILIPGLAAVVFYSYFILRPMAGFDPVFQYYPIRFLFPAVFVACSYQYIFSPRQWSYWLVTLLAGAAVLWNLDTGIVVFITWILTLAYTDWVDNKPREALKKAAWHIGVAFAVLAACVAAFLLFLAVRSGETPQVGLWLKYQGYFTSYGFGMVPMRLISPWNMAILVYAAGIAYAVKAFFTGAATTRQKAVFMLSILGAGVFSYYQGGSEEWNMFSVWYPALILIVMAADGALTAFSGDRRGSYPSLALFGVAWIVLMSGFCGLIIKGAENYPALAARAANRTITPVTDGVDYIKQNTRPGEPVLILSYNAGAYYAESRTVNALDGPGYSELFMRRDYEEFIRAIESKQARKVFLDRSFLNMTPSKFALDVSINRGLIKAVKDNYYRSAISNTGNMELYKPKKR